MSLCASSAIWTDIPGYQHHIGLKEVPHGISSGRVLLARLDEQDYILCG